MFSLAGCGNGLPAGFDPLPRSNFPPCSRLNLRHELRAYGDAGGFPRRAGTRGFARSPGENRIQWKRASCRRWWENRAIASPSEGGIADVEDNIRSRDLEVLVAAAITVVFGVANKVLYKLALVPLKHYPFFLAQIATFGRCSGTRSYGEAFSKCRTPVMGKKFVGVCVYDVGNNKGSLMGRF